MNYWIAAFNYVVSDPFFWPAMAFTVMVGIFIGAVIHNGDLKQIKKAVVSLFCYVLLVTSVSVNRVIPQIGPETPPSHPFASAVTILMVTFFYLLGMSLGVFIVKKARKTFDRKSTI